MSAYCDLRGRIKGTARTLYPVFVERAVYGQYIIVWTILLAIKHASVR